MTVLRYTFIPTIHFNKEFHNHLQIFLPSGQLKSITELATIRLNDGDAEIERENLQSMG